MSEPEARAPAGVRARRMLHAALLCLALPAFGAHAETDPVEISEPQELSRPAALAPPGNEADDTLDALSAELDATGAANPDPFEPVNRQIFVFNRGVDVAVLDPITRAYRFVLGDFARQSIRNVFANLNTPVVLVNNLLQLHAGDAAITTARLVVNSTLGMGGLFDPASTFGLAPCVTGFGETLNAAGLASGPYLIVPLLGPTTVRDGFGNIVDAAMAPQTYILPVLGTVLLTGSSGVVERERHFDGLEALREQSVDFYASLRSAYFDSKR